MFTLQMYFNITFVLIFPKHINTQPTLMLVLISSILSLDSKTSIWTPTHSTHQYSIPRNYSTLDQQYSTSAFLYTSWLCWGGGLFIQETIYINRPQVWTPKYQEYSIWLHQQNKKSIMRQKNNMLFLRPSLV